MRKHQFSPINNFGIKHPFPNRTIDYDIHGHKLEEVESAKYLGVTIQ
jgi:hypothetical protein